jgi:GPH family glycoside/pentoside/hexuronide:cation symporter
LLITALFSSSNAIKQGIIIIYFTHYFNNQLLAAASYLVGLMLVSIKRIFNDSLSNNGKRKMFIYSLLFSWAVISLLIFCDSTAVVVIFTIGLLSNS